MTAPRGALAERLRELLAGRDVREVRMFGGISFMVDDKLVVAAGRDGDLLVRIEPSRHDELLQVPGARDSFMGADRPMGPGWITVSGSHLESAEELAFWTRVGLEHHTEQPRKTR